MAALKHKQKAKTSTRLRNKEKMQITTVDSNYVARRNNENKLAKNITFSKKITISLLKLMINGKYDPKQTENSDITYYDKERTGQILE